MQPNRYRILSAIVLAVLMAVGAVAQTSTTGSLEGRVTDASGPIPGVTVEVSSPSLQGTRVAVSDSNGQFRFSLLPPGNYTMTAALAGFNTVRQPNVQVGLGRTVTLDVRLSPSTVSQEITITAEAPVVDVSSTTTGANITSETMESLPLARNFYAVAQVAPGTNSDASGTTFYGSTGAENQYIIDGLNTTGVELGTEAKQLNFDFIQEVEVITGGLPAEYGRVTGGIINAITKSGGNEFNGDVYSFFAGGGLRSDDSTAAERPGTTTTVLDVDEQFDFGLNLGGYLVRDTLWFFGAYNRVAETDQFTVIRDLEGAPGTPEIGSVIDQDISRDLYAGKLTWNIAANHNLNLSLLGDPSAIDGAVFAVAGPPTTYEGETETGGTDWIARYGGLFANSWVVNALAGTHHEENFTTGPGKFLPQYIDQTVAAGKPLPLSGGFGFHQDQEFDRDVIKLDVSKFFGNHDIKVGGDMEELSAYNENWNGGAGQRIYIRRSSSAGIYYRHRFYIDDQAPGYDPDDPDSWVLAVPLTTTPETTNTAFYVQDSWRVLPNFTLNVGVRWEEQDIKDRFADSSLVLDGNWAPRVGVIWDVMNNGRSKLFANYGRFFESIPMDINIRAFGGEVQCFCYNFDADPSAIQPDPDAPARSGLLGGATAVDPDLKGQYVDEILLGYEYELANNLAVGVQGTYRDLGRVIEDFLDPVSGAYHIANPGEGNGRFMSFYDYEPALAPAVERIYTGVQIHARRRFSNSLQFYASYLWSELEGNYDGLYQASTGQLDPNINSAFDYADFMINADGLLSNDRTHQAKFNGSYLVPEGTPLAGLTVGLSTYFASGTPLNAYGYSLGYQNYEYYLVPRGSLGRGPDEYEADIHLGYPVEFGGVTANFMVDVFNLLDRQSATRLDERYNLSSEADPCAGIPDGLCGSGGGIQYADINEIPQPIGAIPNPRASATNPDFLSSGVAFTAPRSIRFGVRLSF